MSFISFKYLIFLVFSVFLYYVVPNKYRNYLLVILSFVFYFIYNLSFGFLLLATSLFAYFLGKKINSTDINSRKKTLIFSIILFVTILVIFKYGYLIKNSNIILPIGLSFYTLSILSYLIDTYNSKIDTDVKIIDLFLYISFFPKLLLGPLEKPDSFFKQIKSKHLFNWENIWKGLFIILYGFFLKIVIADRACLFVDSIYNNINKYSGLYFVIAIFVYSIQIYCDFMGYSYIAKGSAKLLGFELIENFNHPYLSNSINEFWKGWHISLTSWFREYIYFPLGGNKKGKYRTLINKMIIFIISGMWHGSTINFIIWGFLNGLYVVIEDLLRPTQLKIESAIKFKRGSFIYRIFAVIRTFVLISFSWIFFRANSISDALYIVKSIFTLNNLHILFDGSLFDFSLGLGGKNTILLVIVCVVLFIFDCLRTRNITIDEIFVNKNVYIKGIIIAIFCLIVLTIGKYGMNVDMSSFIYARF